MSDFIRNRIDYLASLARNHQAFSYAEMDGATSDVAAEMLHHLRTGQHVAGAAIDRNVTPGFDRIVSPLNFRLMTIADYVPPNVSGEDLTHRIGADFQTARAGASPDWKPVERPCLGIVHHTVRDE